MKLFRSLFIYAAGAAVGLMCAMAGAIAAPNGSADLGGLVFSQPAPRLDFIAVEMLHQALVGGLVLFAIAALVLATFAIPWRSRRPPERIRSALVFPFERSPRPPI